MAVIKPLRGMRFTKEAGALGELVCPPYDVVSDQERREYIARNPHNLIRLELPREGEEPYAEAGALLRRWLDQGVLAVDEQPGLYVYEEEFEAAGSRRTVKGFHCAVGLEEFSKGVVLPHEETLSKAKEDRLNLMKACGCNFSPIYSLYFDPDNRVRPLIDGLSQGRPDEEFTGRDGVTHRLWRAYDQEALAAVSAAFTGKKLYIADGHHRYETALNYRRWLAQRGEEAPGAGYVMMTLVNMEHEGLVVFPTHRVVRDLHSLDLDSALAACGRYFAVRELQGPLSRVMEALEGCYRAGENAFALYGTGRFWLLTLTDSAAMAALHPERSAAYWGLDVSVLHSLVLERCFGIDRENMANQKNLAYTRDAAEAVGAVDEGRANFAVLLNPTRVEQIAAVAAAGDKMPQKSTYFYPKIITGTVMNKLI